MAQTLVYLLRHAQSIPEEGVKNKDWSLSGEGKAQAERLVRSLDSLGIDVVYSSPYMRALQTVEPYLQEKGIQVHEDSAFAELKAAEDYMDPVAFQDLTKQMLQDVFYAQDGMESVKSCQMRFVRGLNRIVKENVGKNILVCTHGMPLFSVLKFFDETYDYDAWCRMHMPDIYRLVSDVEGGRLDRKFEMDLK